MKTKLIAVGILVLVIFLSGCIQEEPETKSNILFQDNFETAENWELEDGWSLVEVDNNTMLKGEGHKWATLREKSWDNYSLKLRFQRVKGNLHINFRTTFLEEGPKRYFVSLDQGENIALQKQLESEESIEHIKNIPLSITKNWHTIEIRAHGSLINVYLDEDIILIYDDSNPILSGGIAFETFEDGEFLIDDIEVSIVEAEDVIEQTQAVRANNTTKSGAFVKDEIWSGDILITGDVTMSGDLIILPGTTVRFAVQDDQQTGSEVLADGFNDLDPTRLLSYGKTHSSLTVTGTLIAVGTPENRILFTSAVKNPKIADWEAIYPQGDGSLIEYATIEWSRNGISPGNDVPNSIFRNNIINYTMWGSISTGWSGCQVYNNEIYECGHEGIDVQGGTPIIKNNTIYDCHAGIIILRGSAVVKNNVMKNVGSGVHPGKDATPVLENNIVEIAPWDSTKEWCYQSFCYPQFGEPEGTPILTEVYKEELPRYATSAYRIEYQDYTVELPFEADEWLFYGWKNDKWNRIEPEIVGNECEFPSDYSMYVVIPEPTADEIDAAKFNEEHANIYRIMGV